MVGERSTENGFSEIFGPPPCLSICAKSWPVRLDDAPIIIWLRHASVASQDKFVTGLIGWLRWPEGKRSELGGRFRTAVLQEHCGSLWQSKWFDPASDALSLPREDPYRSEPERPQGKEFSFFGLGRASWVDDWPASMFVAGAILPRENVPRRIRFSGILHSIKPLLFDTAGDGMAWKRFLMCWRLVALIEPQDILAAMRKMLRTILKK
jgi:hypothetical protein